MVGVKVTAQADKPATLHTVRGFSPQPRSSILEVKDAVHAEQCKWSAGPVIKGGWPLGLSAEESQGEAYPHSDESFSQRTREGHRGHHRDEGPERDAL